MPGATAEAADAGRLERITSALRAAGEAPVETVHAAFASALAMAEPRGFLANTEWFRSYAQRLARSLAADPARRFRGWLGAHFSLVAGEADTARQAARRIVETQPPGAAWLEASRIAFHLGDAAGARSWLHAACLEGSTDISPEPPALEASGVYVLEASLSLPRLPAPVEDLFEAVRSLDDLPGRRARWVAVLGEIDRVLAPAVAGDGEPDQSRAPDDDEARSFLVALRAARRSRERDGARGPDRCSDRELRARRRMQRISPVLFARYLRGLGSPLR